MKRTAGIGIGNELRMAVRPGWSITTSPASGIFLTMPDTLGRQRVQLIVVRPEQFDRQIGPHAFEQFVEPHGNGLVEFQFLAGHAVFDGRLDDLRQFGFGDMVAVDFAPFGARLGS